MPAETRCAAQISDESLLAAIQEGSQDGFALLVQRHANRFYGLAYRIMHHREDAEDIVQEAFLRLWQKPEAWRADLRSKFTSWFYRVVVNLCLDRKRAPAWDEFTDDHDSPDPTLDGEAIMTALQNAELIWQQVSSLPLRQQVALQLYYYDELPQQEAADAMELQLKAFQSLLHRARLSLKEKMIMSGTQNHLNGGNHAVASK